MDVASIGIMKEIRRVSDPDKAQIIWDGIKTVRAQKQIPALPRLSRYMNRYQSNLYLTLKVSTLKDHLSSKSSHNFSFKSLSFIDQSRRYFDIAQWGSSVGFLKSYFFECKSGRNSIKVAEKWT